MNINLKKNNNLKEILLKLKSIISNMINRYSKWSKLGLQLIVISSIFNIFSYYTFKNTVYVGSMDQNILLIYTIISLLVFVIGIVMFIAGHDDDFE